MLKISLIFVLLCAPIALSQTTPHQGGLTVTGALTGETISTTATGATEWKLFEDAANGNDYTSWRAPTLLGAILRYIMPETAPTAGQFFRAVDAPDGSGFVQSEWAGIASADLPNPGASAGGKVQSKTCTAGDFVSSINTDSTVTCGTPSGGGISTLALVTQQAATTLSAGADTDITGATSSISPPGAGKCVDITLSTIASGATGKTYKLQFGATLYSISNGAQTSASGSYYSIRLCNNPGVQNAQTISWRGGHGTAGIIANTDVATEDWSSAKTIKLIANCSAAETVTAKLWHIVGAY